MARKLIKKPVEKKEKLLTLILTREQWIELKNWMGWILTHRDSHSVRKKLSEYEKACLQNAYRKIDAATKTNRFEVEITDSNWVMQQVPVTLYRAVSGGGKLAHFGAQQYGEICKVLNGSRKDSDKNGW